MVKKVSPLNSDRAIIDATGAPTQQARFFFLELGELAMIIGTGSPEGAVEARQGALYMDDSGSTGSILYIKKLSSIGGDISQGWILV